jgi:hypothetical protein
VLLFLYLTDAEYYYTGSIRNEKRSIIDESAQSAGAGYYHRSRACGNFQYLGNESDRFKKSGAGNPEAITFIAGLFLCYCSIKPGYSSIQSWLYLLSLT